MSRRYMTALGAVAVMLSMLTGGQVLIERGQQPGVRCMTRHQTNDEVRKVPLAENLHGPRVCLRTHVVPAEKLATEFD